MEKHSRLLYSCQRSGLNSPIISDKDHERVLASCIDIPRERPDFYIPLNDVGIKNKTIWLKLPNGLTPFKADIRIDLPGKNKGIHMSRIEELISNLLEEEFEDIGFYALKLAEQTLLSQEAERAKIFIEGKIPLLQKTPASLKLSLDSLDITAYAEAYLKEEELKSRLIISAGVHHITACPCTQAYNEVYFENQDKLPLITHSQRSFTKLSMERRDNCPSFTELFNCLNASLHVSSDLLKRTDEAEIVLKAHIKPQFAEDTVRATAYNSGLYFKDKLPPESLIEISSHSFESIHTHDVIAELRTDLGEIIRTIEDFKSESIAEAVHER